MRVSTAYRGLAVHPQRKSNGQALRERAVPSENLTAIVYYLGLLDHDAVFDQGRGRELAHTFGAQIFGDTGAWFWNVEGALQRGTFATHRVAAWGIGGEFGYRFLQTPLQPELRFMSDVISGDNNPDDPNLVRSGQGSDARFIGHQIELSVAWQATAELNLSASVSAFEAGRFISETGPARTITLISMMANVRF